jgi:hypothetical protein
MLNSLKLGFASRIPETMAKERAGEGEGHFHGERGRGQGSQPEAGRLCGAARAGFRASVVLRWWQRVVFLRALRSGGFSGDIGRVDSAVGDGIGCGGCLRFLGPSFSPCLPKLAVLT